MAPIKIGIIGGSGLDDPDFLKNRKEKQVTTPFGDPSDVVVEGDIAGVPCSILARHGRKHNVMPGNVNYRANIWALKQEGCTHIIATTATGSLQEHIHPGDLVILSSFIDRTTGRAQTFYDAEPNHPEGVCHIPMEPAYCEKTRSIIINTAKELGYPAHEKGTVIAIEGPRYASKAESLMHKQWGADVVNMTSVPEVVLAKEAGIFYVSIALATDYDCWKSDHERVSAPAVVRKFKENVGKVTDIILSAVPKIAQEDWSEEMCKFKYLLNESTKAH